MLAVVLAWSAPSHAQTDTIVIGSVIAFTGKHSINGIHTRNGYQLAVNTINASGGVKIAGRSFKLVLKFVDDGSSPADTATQVEKLITEDGVQFMLGPYGTASIKAAIEVTEKYTVPMIETTSAAKSLFTKNYRYLFTVLSTTDRYLSGVVDLAAQNAEKLGKKPADIKLALAFDKGSFSQEIRNGVIAASKIHEMEIVIDDSIPKNLADISTTLLKVLSVKPDVLLISGHARTAATAVRQMGEFQLSVPLIGMTHCEAANIIADPSKRAEHVICPTHWAADVNYRGPQFGSAQDYARTFTDTYPDYDTVPYQSALASAAILVFKDAFQRANSLDRNAVRDALAATRLNTFYGPIEFSAAGDNVAKPMPLRQIQGGRFKVIVPAAKTAGRPAPPKRLTSCGHFGLCHAAPGPFTMRKTTSSP